MIVAGTHPAINIDLGSNEPGMILQRREDREWVNYKVDGKVDFFVWHSLVNSPFSCDRGNRLIHIPVHKQYQP